MKITLTVKCTPETRGEMIDTFAGKTRELQTAFQETIAAGRFFGFPPENVELRFVVEGGQRWVGQA